MTRISGGVLFTFGVALGSVPAARAGQPIEFSEPRRDTTVTNLNQLGEDTARTENPERESGRAEAFNPSQGSLYGMLPPPQSGGGSVIINKRGKDPYGLFSSSEPSTPEEAIQELLLKDLLKMPSFDAGKANQQKQPSASPLGSYYERFLGVGTEAGSRNKASDVFGLRKGGEEGKNSSDEGDTMSPWADADLSSGNRPESALGSRHSPSGVGPGGLLGALGYERDRRAYDFGPEAMREKVEQVDQLKRFQALLEGVYDLQQTPTAQNSGVAPNPLGTPALPLAESESRNPFASGSGLINSALASPMAPTAPVPSSLSPAPYTPPPRTAPPKPVFAPPQRVF